jgi:hypothetical protein
MEHMKYLNQIVGNDIHELERKEATYQGSWKRRGGVGAFMMVARKIDRLETMCQQNQYDIFLAVGAELSGADGTALAEIRDLRRYLLLIEAEILARNAMAWTTIQQTEQNKPGSPEDGGHHEAYNALQEKGQRFGPDEKLKQPQDAPEPKWLERLDDGIRTMEIQRGNREWYMTAIGNGHGYNIVDRRKTPKELWEHLPRLRIELNNKEYEEMSDYYKGIYEWAGISSKWIMRKPYQEHWGKE